MTDTQPVSLDHIDQFSRAALAAHGADTETANDATRAMLHGSLHGVDSHGIRLLPHYCKALAGGRVNGNPTLTFNQTRPGSGLLDAGDAHGARAAYAAVGHATDMARVAGVGAVGIARSSHFGPAGAYALELTRMGMIGIVFCNSDAFVRLHDGAARFHGTNPISVGVPAPGDPWLLDMATSSIPYNRVLLHRSLGRDMPPHTASDIDGVDTTDPHAIEMLAPLGGEQGYKGAGLAGVAEILSSVLTGMRISTDILPMNGEDFATPRDMGAFVMALDPEAFIGAKLFEHAIQHYLTTLRASPARDGARVMAPGDREWAVAADRRANGVPLDPATLASFAEISQSKGIAWPIAD